MSTFTYAIQVSDGPQGNETWMTEANYDGTEDFDGTAEQYAKIVLDNYLSDVASDAEVPVGEPGSEPCAPTRIVVWSGPQQDSISMASAVVYA